MDIMVLASGSSGNCYLISDGCTDLLLDAGIPIRRIQIGCDFDLFRISGCLVTHCHSDHSKAVKDLLKKCVDVWMPGNEISKLGLQAGRRLHPLECTGGNEYAMFSIGTFDILPFRTEHDTPEPVGYLLHSRSNGDKILYVTDSFFIRYRFNGLTHIIGEVNYDEKTVWEKINNGETPTERAKRLFRSHMSLENFLAFLGANDLSKLRQIYICHMSKDHGNAKRIQEAVQQATGAEVYVCKEGGGISAMDKCT
jgi:phosphoribosyl 1,2-cyclic phosphodiesterase